MERAAVWLSFFLMVGSCNGPRALLEPPPTVTTLEAKEPTEIIEGVVGTAHPALVQAVDPEGRWVFLCQARRDTDGRDGITVYTEMHGELFGDEVVPYLVLGSGPGEPIESFIGSDESGRWIVVQRGGVVELVDVSTMQRTSLGAVPREHTTPLRAHPSFDFEGGHLARVDTSGAVLVRELATGREARIDPGPGLLVAVRLEPGADALSLYVVLRDTDGDGRIAAPTLQTSLADGGACHGAPSSYSVAGHVGDEVERRIAPARGGLARAVDGLVATWGSAAIVRTDDGALVLDDGSATRTEIAPASCAAELFVPSRHGGAVIVYCHDDGDLMLWRGSALEPLGVAVPVTEPEERWPGVRSGGALRMTARSTDEVALFSWPTLAIELASGVVTRFPEGQWLLAAHGRHVVLGQAGPLVIAELGSGAPLAPLPIGGHPSEIAGRFLAIDGQVIDIERGALAGRYDGHIAALTRDGRVLVSAERDHGPLTWRATTPADRWPEAE